MKMSFLLSALLLSPLLAFANSDNNSSEHLTFSSLPKNKNTLTRHYSNEQERPDLNLMEQRTIDFPTQIVRVRGNVTGLKLSCAEVQDEIDRVFSKKSLPIGLSTTLMSTAAMMRKAPNNMR